MCCSCHPPGISRRSFLGATALGVASAAIPSGRAAASGPRADGWDPDQPLLRTGTPLRVQPILLYSLSERREQTSWRPWGGLHTEQDVAEESARIRSELEALEARADFELEIQPLVAVRNVEEASKVRDAEGYDIPIVYAASGWTDALEACFSEARHSLIFLRHRSGPVYLWYEIVHNRFLRQGNATEDLDEYRYPSGMTVHDVVVDEYDDVLTRLRALYGVHNFVGRKIVALGGSSGWCNPEAPEIARTKFSLDIVPVEYEDLGRRIESARRDPDRMARMNQWARRYLEMPGTSLHTGEPFVINGFLLYDLIKEYLREHEAAAFTIQECMGTVMPIAETTACLPLSLLNDEGYLAFCESDFNVIPAGILLHYVSGRPVFLNDPTFPHHGMVTVAHCTAPRRMEGSRYAEARVVTHFESDYGATPKVELPLGTPLTMVCPDGRQKEWVGFSGKVLANPFHDICRSQFDVSIDGNWKKLLEDHRGFHWMMAAGGYAEEMAYACPKIGIEWNDVSVKA
jgi:L-fucose isomerase-like protein